MPPASAASLAMPPPARAELPAAAAPQLDGLVSQFNQMRDLLQAHLSDKVWGDFKQSQEHALMLRSLLNAGCRRVCLSSSTVAAKAKSRSRPIATPSTG